MLHGARKVSNIYRKLASSLSNEYSRAMSGEACGISFSRPHCCCCCCRLNKDVMQISTTRKTIETSSSATPTSATSRQFDRLRRLRANGRERDRMHALNSSLARLRDVLPTGSGSTTRHRSTAMSKIATLRAAQNYIRVLSSALAELESRDAKGRTIPAGARCSVLCSGGEITHRLQSDRFDGVSQQPEVASDDVTRERRTALSDCSVSQQMSLVDQRALSCGKLRQKF